MMKAVVMAGGSGSRLRPLTVGRPKPMVPLVNKPVLAHILDLLKRHNFSEVVITVQYLADLIQDYFGDGSSVGLTIHYAVEEVPLGTAGSVKNAQRYLDEPFLVISGDDVADIDLSDIFRFHREHRSLATLTLKSVTSPLEYGIVTTDGEGHITQFLEKPSWGQVISDTVNTGVYVLEPEVLDLLEPDAQYDFSQDVFPALLSKGAPLFGYVTDGYWCDIGNIQAYMKATTDVLEGKVRHIKMGNHIGGGVWVGQGVEIAPDAALYGPLYLGNEVKIKGGVVIHGPAVIRDYTIVDNRVQIERSVIWRNCYVGEAAEVRGSVISRQCNLKAKAVLFEGTVVGDHSLIGEGAVIHPNVKIWPGKEIEPGATVKSSIIWGSQGRRVLFGRYGVTGVVNVDLTPEFAARLGAAFGATLPKGSLITINRDPHRSPRMLKRAIISGLPSAGVNAWDLGTQPIPVARYYTHHSDAVAGVHVRLSPYDQRVVDIRFIDSTGHNLDDAQKRHVEQVFFREDFRRVYLDEIGTINYAPQVVERYTEGFLRAINYDAIRNAQFYIVVDYANAPISAVLPGILSKLNCNVVALNANIDETRMAIQPHAFQAALERLGLIASALSTNIGVRLDVGGEKIFLVDNQGNRLENTTAAAAIAKLAFRAIPGATVAVPVTMPNVFEQIADQHGGHVIRTKVDSHTLTKVACETSVTMAADGNGNFIFSEFQCASDGLMAIAKLLEFLATQQTTLQQVIAELPPFKVAQSQVSCPWEVKGLVMRRLNEHSRRSQVETTDGVKITLNETDWVLVLPDPDYPLFRIYAESASQDQAKALTQKYVDLVKKLQE
ncbi:MAG: mannose-1-phosphate guanyltransferase [Anaerolineales bacterium]|nr:MAG: mannose-1-phosphate guanyltransferase [Anaerolineales bacterium]